MKTECECTDSGLFWYEAAKDISLKISLYQAVSCDESGDGGPEAAESPWCGGGRRAPLRWVSVMSLAAVRREGC